MGNSCTGSRQHLVVTAADLKFLVSRTSYDIASIKLWYEEFRQECPTGLLDRETFSGMYSLFFPDRNTKEFCDHVFRTFDLDQNGVIDFREFMLAIDLKASGKLDDKLKWAFRMYDINKNGVITLEEMIQIVGSVYDIVAAPKENAEQKANNIFNLMDINNDGVITQEEFINVYRDNQTLEKDDKAIIELI